MITTKSVRDLPTVHLARENLVELPSFLARTATEHGPIFRVVADPAEATGWARRNVSLIYMVGPEANRFVLSSHRDHFHYTWKGIGNAYGSGGLLNLNGERYTRDRRLINPPFTISGTAAYLPTILRAIAEQTRDWTARGEVDLYEETRTITFSVIHEILIGSQRDDQRALLRDAFNTALVTGAGRPAERPAQPLDDDGAAAADGPSRPEKPGGFRAWSAQTISKIVLPLIAERRAAAAAGAPAEQPTNILDLLVRARDEQGDMFTDDEILAHLNTLFVSGHETSTMVGAWLLYLLSSHPTYLERVLTEIATVLGGPHRPITSEALRAMTVLGRAFTETARLHSPVGAPPRVVVKECEFGGYTLPVGTYIRYAIGAGHRLPHVFANPDAFDPDRFAPPREEDRQHPHALALFGGGARPCIGQHLAQAEIKALAASILPSFVLQPIPERPVVESDYGRGGIAYIPSGIWVRVTPRT